jgi:AraC-like DNA-binding protein
MKLIEARLKFSDKRINEISGEFGFTDESHFNKFFRKNNGVSPSVYRKETTQALTTQA